ncbi:aspartyl-phosphate phosphatase Spo0E family protein [Desulfosporosinus sp. BICA1-9]|uniref:aspartyl-phosphate phosphatase Spo0E family protein n=1 Tax=Desulfosporosinus sp. BICA1-9 TaxID=1531958 RepID=UPI00054C5C37|nr:aspartyl-phosphate phosphatase Spo0E family protein [Desulfosporosinus sp. BICA1-9]KJS48538.1 MAG: sporulation protein Spo0E [Peptococcaceae bacterium BRH_c23]KJS89217.1 MAG: sporulation protein Spo0E [Desulfosporosinus sp. BICA1-9]HBW36896.1 aspartyl-phosphate phosphatase Spo0E family protein [Desulfosporosinus sp.]
MSELDRKLKQIEELRFKMLKIKEGKSFTDPEVLAASQRLDIDLNKYHDLIIKMKKGENY